MRNIVVTGATGFIGRRLVARLVARYGTQAITCLVFRDGSGEAERRGRAVLRDLGVETQAVDLLDPASLGALPRHPDLLFHLASNIDTGARDHRVDDLGTSHLLEAVGPLGKETRLIFSSSIATMDHRRPIHAPARPDSSLLEPFSEYGRRKLRAEGILREAALRQGFELIVARLCAVYGDGLRDNGLFGEIGNMVRNEAWVRRLDYPGKITLMHVDDMVEILFRLATQPIETGQIATCLLGAEVRSVAEIIAAAHRRYGKTYAPLRAPRKFWRACAGVGQGLLHLHPYLPHEAANKLWQLALTVTDTLWFDVASTRSRYADIRFREFEAAVAEVW